MNANPLPGKSISGDALAQFARSGKLYAVLDACDAPSVLRKIQELPQDQVTCLYINQAEEDFSSFAPYLCRVDSALFAWAHEAAAQTGGGIFAISDAEQSVLHKHLRRFLLVTDPDGEEMYFRFYDPRVLPKFLAVCTLAERRDLFGPILAFGVINEGVITLLQEDAGPLPETAAPRPSRVGFFQVRPEHMKAFSQEGERAFEGRVVDHLRQFHSDCAAPFSDETLVVMTRTGIARARRYGLISEADLTAFVAIMFKTAPNFDRHPFIQDVLTDRKILPGDKINALVKRVPDFVWEEAARRYDITAWNMPSKETA